MDDHELIHYGVKGMRWGVRKARPTSGTRKKASGTSRLRKMVQKRKRQKAAAAKAKAAPQEKKSNPLSSMSDEELRRKLNRLQMEKQYRELTAPQLSAGRKFANEVLRSSAKNVATKYVTEFATTTIDKALKKKR